MKFQICFQFALPGKFALLQLCCFATRHAWHALLLIPLAMKTWFLNITAAACLVSGVLAAPLLTPDDKRGRVLAVESVFIGASNELGAFESGIVAQAIGTPATVIGGGVATIAIVGVWWFSFPSLRNVDRFEDLGH